VMNRALSIKEILPLPTNRAFIVGTTGSGKTTLAKEMLRWRRNVLILDSKGLIDWPGYERHSVLKTLFKSKAKRIIYRPSLEESEFDRIELFFKWSYLRRNHTLYIDESNAVTTATYIPFYLKGIITGGEN
jgi:MoxR-like ATPase